jgi:hypothetical protein
MLRMMTYVLVSIFGCFALSGCSGLSSSSQLSVSNAQTSRSISEPSTTPKNLIRDPQRIGDQVFQPILTTLRTRTTVPLRLPRYLATENETNKLYAIIDSASPSQYDIQIAFTEDCSGGNVCHFGSVSGHKIGPNESPMKGTSVRLQNGITASFVNAICGASCSDSTLTWDENGYRYMVGFKAEKLDTLKKVAESATRK